MQEVPVRTSKLLHRSVAIYLRARLSGELLQQRHEGGPLRHGVDVLRGSKPDLEVLEDAMTDLEVARLQQDLAATAARESASKLAQLLAGL